MKYCIETVDLCKKFGIMEVLHDINIKIKRGGCIGYLGANGAGKTTTMKILTSLLHPTSGKAYINGFDVFENSKDALDSVGSIIGVPAFYPSFTPRKILTYIGELRGISRDDLLPKIVEVLETVDLLQDIDFKIGDFSTGMNQRLGIAQALLSEPEILILDEPTFGMDPKGMKQMRDIFKELKKNHTIFMSSHLLPEVEQLCDEIILIKSGKIVIHDSVKNIKTMLDPDTVQISLAFPNEISLLEQIKTWEVIEDVDIDDGEVYVVYKKGEIELYQLLDKIRALGIKLNAFTPLKGNLETYYLETYGGD